MRTLHQRWWGVFFYPTISIAEAQRSDTEDKKGLLVFHAKIPTPGCFLGPGFLFFSELPELSGFFVVLFLILCANDAHQLRLRLDFLRILCFLAT